MSFQAIVERDQIRIELAETQKRLKKFIDEMNDKIAAEKQTAERHCEDRLKDSADKVDRNRDRCFLLSKHACDV